MDKEKEFEKTINQTLSTEKGSDDPQQTVKLTKLEKRWIALYEKLLDIQDDLRITTDILLITNTCLIDHYDPDADPAIEQATSALIVIGDRLQKIHKDIGSLPYSFKEE